MSDSIFHIFSDERFLDLTVYQYGYEKCEPLHSYGPFVRNHYLFHYIISGKGMLSVTEKDDNAVYHMEAHSGFLIEPGRINLYSADQKFPWEYVWRINLFGRDGLIDVLQIVIMTDRFFFAIKIIME